MNKIKENHFKLSSILLVILSSISAILILIYNNIFVDDIAKKMVLTSNIFSGIELVIRISLLLSFGLYSYNFFSKTNREQVSTNKLTVLVSTIIVVSSKMLPYFTLDTIEQRSLISNSLFFTSSIIINFILVFHLICITIWHNSKDFKEILLISTLILLAIDIQEPTNLYSPYHYGLTGITIIAIMVLLSYVQIKSLLEPKQGKGYEVSLPLFLTRIFSFVFFFTYFYLFFLIYASFSFVNPLQLVLGILAGLAILLSFILNIVCICLTRKIAMRDPYLFLVITIILLRNFNSYKFSYAPITYPVKSILILMAVATIMIVMFKFVRVEELKKGNLDLKILLSLVSLISLIVIISNIVNLVVTFDNSFDSNFVNAIISYVAVIFTNITALFIPIILRISRTRDGKTLDKVIT